MLEEVLWGSLWGTVFWPSEEPWGIPCVEWASIVRAHPWSNSEGRTLFSFSLPVFCLSPKTCYFLILLTGDTKGEQAISQHLPTHVPPQPRDSPGGAVRLVVYHPHTWLLTPAATTGRSCSECSSHEQAVSAAEWGAWARVKYYQRNLRNIWGKLCTRTEGVD